MATFAGAVAATLVIAGCSSASGTPVHTVRWYTGHDEARVAMVQRCDAQPMKLANTPDCIDAHDAAEDLGVQLAGATTQSAPQG
ncbi:MAG TPA: EexN family lipoprotein [Nevskiaceae bacterium]